MNGTHPVALGERSADLAVVGGRVLLAEVPEFQRRDVLVVNNRVAALPADGSDGIGPDTTVLPADGRAVLPGLIDAHTHIDVNQTFETAYHYVLERGTTTVVTEASAFGSAFGADGVKALLSATSYLPITVRVAVPPQPLFDTFERQQADAAETGALLDLLGDDRVVGVGESGWIHVVGRETPAAALYERAEAEGKRVVGHGAGCRGRKLAAFAGTVDNDHEALDGEGVLERLENGLHVVGRAGSVRDDVEAIADAYERAPDAAYSLSTDGVWPRALIGGEGMNAVVARAIGAGIPPATAVRMATLAPAQHFGLEDRGSLAPGNVADAVIVDDLESMNVRTVVSGGEVVVRNHETTVAPRNHAYPDRFYDSVAVEVDASTVRVGAAAAGDGSRVRAVQMGDGLVSTPTVLEPAVRSDGDEATLVPAPDRGVLKAVLLDRSPEEGLGAATSETGSEDAGFTGFCTGLGLERGAVATTITWETPGLLGVGADDDSLRQALAHVADLGGGWAVVDNGGVLAELPTRVAAVCSDLEVEETAKLMSAVEDALRTLGTDVERPLLALQTLTFPGVPALKLTFSGYADVKARRVLGLDPGED